MAVKASAAITVSIERDIQGTWRFYRIASSSSTPSAPTTAQGQAFVSSGTVPSGWSKVEPAYDGTSTNSLYTVDLTAFTDGTVVWTEVSKSSSYEAAKQAYNEAQNAKKTATNYMTDLSNGVYVHANGTPSDPANVNAKGVKITDVIDIIRSGASIGQFGENIRMGKQDSIHFSIDDSKFGYFVDEVPVTTLNCSYELLEEDDDTASEGDVSLKNMELKVTSPVFSETDKEKASLTMHYEHGSGYEHPTYAQLLAQNLDVSNSNYAYVKVTSASGSTWVTLNSRGTTFTVNSDGNAVLNGNLIVQGMAGMVQMFAGSVAPKGWRFCDGTALSRTSYSKLFAVIGTAYGAGDGSTTFNLPDFRDRMPIGAGNLYSRNSSGGSKDAVVPYHKHSVSSVTIGTGGGHSHTVSAKYNSDATHTGSGTRYMASGSKTSTGMATIASGTGTHTHSVPAHDTNYEGTSGNATNANLPPYRGINFIICTGQTS